jgi:hypothetical protein
MLFVGASAHFVALVAIHGLSRLLCAPCVAFLSRESARASSRVFFDPNHVLCERCR